VDAVLDGFAVTQVGDPDLIAGLADALDAAKRSGKIYDLSSLLRMTSSGVMWTMEVKQRLLDHVPQVMLVDGMGATEGGMALSVTTNQTRVETAKFAMNPTTKVFDDDDKEVVPGDGRTGKVANGGLVPVGYFKDAEKSARTFRTINGVRYSFPGDLATFDADGQFVLLGRGSQVINTAGEKVFPEEVEEAVKRYRGVQDCLVIGLPDDKFGQIVVAVASVELGVSVVEPDVIAYFKALSLETHIPYQNLINLYLLDCAREHRKISLKWNSPAANSTP
jgi:fatty-acyl-CoA synthase